VSAGSGREATVLEVRELEAAYGKIRVLWGASFRVAAGETVAILGANGAGKTTILKAVAGLLPPLAGSITFRDQEIARLPAHQVARRGLALVPEGREIFPDMSVYENLLLGGRLQPSRRGVMDTLAWVYTIFPRLRERARQTAATLSGGEQQMLAIARALMSRPHLLLLDEPSTGLAPTAVETIFGVVKTLGAQGATTLLVEQNVHLALEIADRAYVLERGRIVLDGEARQLRDHPLVREAYLGLPVSRPPAGNSR
jgi:branched-chain amino acid transport system ATP-binding protein